MREVRRRAVLGSIDRLFRSGTASGLSDGQLLERFATRHDEAAEAAFGALVERHGPMVLRVCRRVLNDSHDAQDAFQATFLVLMRKAGSVRRRDSVAAWLYGVARRVSAHARASTARRRAVEQAAAVRSSPAGPETAETGRELWDEVDRLPSAAREAVVLCYLEGLTHEQAAERLGWPVGTVRSRLARARERLRGRLERRGLAPDRGGAGRGRDAVAGLLSVLRGAEPVSLPSDLIDTTARAALTLAARDAAEAGLVSAAAASLSQGVLRTMLIAKLKSAAVALVAAGALISGAVVSGSAVSAYQPPPPDDDDRADAPKKEAVRKDIFINKRAPSADSARREQAAQADDISRRLEKLVAEAREQQKSGNDPAARRTLADINRLTFEWLTLLSGQGAGGGPQARFFRGPGPGGGQTVYEFRMQPPDGAGPNPQAVPVPPIPPIPPMPPPAGGLPPVGAGRGFGFGYAGPGTGLGQGAAAAARARESEKRLDEVERKIDRILQALERQGRGTGADREARDEPAANDRGTGAREERRPRQPAQPARPARPARPPQPPREPDREDTV